VREYTFEGKGYLYVNYGLQEFPVHFVLYIPDDQDHSMKDFASDIIGQMLLSREYARMVRSEDELQD